MTKSAVMLLAGDQSKTKPALSRKLLEQPVHYIIGANGTGPAGKARLSICAVFRQEQKMLPDITGSIL